MHIEQQDVDAVIGVVRASGDLVRRMRRAGLNAVRSKTTEIDLVTEADVAGEAFIRSALQRLYPDVGFWGEESNQMPEASYYWLVDPIDGTVNFANGVEYVAVNLALQHGQTTLLAVTYNIYRDLIFFARPGAGAFGRDSAGSEWRLQVNQVARLRQALLITGFPYHRGESSDNNAAEFAYFMPRAAEVRSMGAAALDMVQVAGGAVAGYWEAWIKPWDVAPGALLVREAGGSVVNYLGQEWDITANHIIATNGQPVIRDALLEGIQTARSTLQETRLPQLSRAGA